jgi:hypothetical protein
MRRIVSNFPLTSIALTFACCATLSFAQNRFVQVPSYPTGGSLPKLLAQHDVNGDGKVDLIVLNVNATAKTETVSLLLGTGTGGYDAPKTMGTYPSSYLNKDGNPDLITADYNGSGSFNPHASAAVGETVE